MATIHRQTVPRTLLFLALLALLLPLSGCSTMQGMFDKITFGSSESKPEQDSAQALAVQGMDAFNRGDYYEALQAFNKILDRYPFSPQAMLAELKAADCHYYRKEYLEAKMLYQEFENRHPTNEAIPYVMFQIGMCDFRRIDRIDRDITGAQDAIKSFSRLLRAYPDSPYSQEARARIAAAREFLVNHDYFVAVFYVRTKQYSQAIHRLKYLLATYPDATIAPKARALLKRLQEGKPPVWGLRKWLPHLTMPDWRFWSSDHKKKDTAGGTRSTPPANTDAAPAK
ncbi:MAG TPA: outer membrane protein assembly factor BamD [Desulfobulbus sp.]|nr:outer membrane protein assembly factor BamD [Desulfobulbus sp.]